MLAVQLVLRQAKSLQKSDHGESLLTGTQNDGHLVKSRLSTAPPHHWSHQTVVDIGGLERGSSELRGQRGWRCSRASGAMKLRLK